MSVFTDRPVAKASAHSDPLECISGNGVPTGTRSRRGGRGRAEGEAATGSRPLLSLPGFPLSPELISVVFVEF